jgi:hypothetical protein
MKRLLLVCLSAFLIVAVAVDAFAWRGGGPRGGTIAQGPRGGTIAQGPRGGTIAQGPRGNTAIQGPRGNTAVVGNTYRGAYYPGAGIVAGAAVGVAVGAATTYPAPYYTAPTYCGYYPYPAC